MAKNSTEKPDLDKLRLKLIEEAFKRAGMIQLVHPSINANYMVFKGELIFHYNTFDDNTRTVTLNIKSKKIKETKNIKEKNIHTAVIKPQIGPGFTRA